MRITTLTPDHLDAAVHVLARAFVTNPLHVAVFGPGALEANEAFFRVGFSAMTGDKRLVLDDGRIVGVAHWVDAPGCQFSPVQKIANAVPLLRGCGLRSMAKILPWLSAWSRRDPASRTRTLVRSVSIPTYRDVASGGC